MSLRIQSYLKVQKITKKHSLLIIKKVVRIKIKIQAQLLMKQFKCKAKNLSWIKLKIKVKRVIKNHHNHQIKVAPNLLEKKAESLLHLVMEIRIGMKSLQAPLKTKRKNMALLKAKTKIQTRTKTKTIKKMLTNNHIYKEDCLKT